MTTTSGTQVTSAEEGEINKKEIPPPFFILRVLQSLGLNREAHSQTNSELLPTKDCANVVILISGQVCLLGAFQEKRRKVRGRIALSFRLEPKQKTFKQVDRMPKDMVKDLYLQTLTRSVRHGERNKTK